MRTDADFDEQGGWVADSVNAGAPSWSGGGGLTSRSPGTGGAVADWIDIDVPQDTEHREYYLAQANGVTPVVAVRLQGSMDASGSNITAPQGAFISWQLYAYYDPNWASTNPGWLPATATLIKSGGQLVTAAPTSLDVSFMLPTASLWVQFFLVTTATQGESDHSGPIYTIRNRYDYAAGWTTKALIELSALTLTEITGVGILGPCDCTPWVNQCLGPGGVGITDTFNRAVVSGDWGTGTGGYGNSSGSGNGLSTDGSNGVLDTSADPSSTSVRSGPAGPIITPSLNFEMTFAFRCDTDINDIPAGPGGGIVPARSIDIFILSDFSPFFFGLEQTITSAGVITSFINVNVSSPAFSDQIAVTFIKNLWYTFRVKVSTSAFEFGYQPGDVSFPTTIYSHSDTYTVPPSPVIGNRGKPTFNGGGTDVDPLRVDLVTLIDWIAVVGFPPCDVVQPTANQPVEDENVGTGDGVTTDYLTQNAYLPGSLEISVAGMLAEVDNTNPKTGEFNLVNPPPNGASIRATYRASGA